MDYNNYNDSKRPSTSREESQRQICTAGIAQLPPGYYRQKEYLERVIDQPSAFEHTQGPASLSKQISAIKSHIDEYYGREEEKPAPAPVPKKSPRKETLLEWFDRTVEEELEKRRDTSLTSAAKALVDPGSFNSPKADRGKLHPLLVDASVSGIDIKAQLRSGQDTDLLLAVDKLAKAEAMVAFEGAVRAAEEAAANAPPELAEEAAAASVRMFNKEITSVVQQAVPGIKPIEVVGYVGITRPKKAKKT